MNELFELLNSLERRGWVCVLKWDGKRSSKSKTVIAQKPSENNIFRGDFNDFDHALDQLRAWIQGQDSAHP